MGRRCSRCCWFRRQTQARRRGGNRQLGKARDKLVVEEILAEVGPLFLHCMENGNIRLPDPTMLLPHLPGRTVVWLEKEGEAHEPLGVSLRSVSPASAQNQAPLDFSWVISRHAQRDRYQSRFNPQPIDSLSRPTSPTLKHNDWKRWWWRSQGSPAANQFSFPPPPTAHDGPDLAIRAGVYPHYWHHPGKRLERPFGL